ncbi:MULTISPECIES: hypothetical protein [Polynucleobacter]|jgi:uncharacterized protein YycO|uniref:Uncharacterized protein n=1 Tax=Polynucleobacter wuianus TaxID=1743168 RepID=A0A191UGT7_9BURK|nr:MULTISPECIES: hypothetical protein [Polynucleobacter]ANJ00229.1 hypothetical protein A8O14_09145 [Polynucleobacter wuianus]MBU3553852.1 hypothetical protein [Polynucleobacter sp. MWH-Post4-6-1]MDF9789263.1 uncharacterized protein YycO [Polynucleobacter sphagniphilus]MDH6250266.1 uncharacterized protein YycO [Polynucleobacter sphagniphilus]MDH6300947.1 uncharacterized protein YycO [Polynucleobacter sphagniphilus]
MRSNDKKYLKKALDQIEVQSSSSDFEQRIYQDWQRTVTKVEKPSNRFSEVLVLLKLHPKRVTFLLIALVITSALLTQKLLVNSQDDELRRIDALSELSLSTI